MIYYGTEGGTKDKCISGSAYERLGWLKTI
jgi:hypothetical protein